MDSLICWAGTLQELFISRREVIAYIIKFFNLRQLILVDLCGMIEQKRTIPRVGKNLKVYISLFLHQFFLFIIKNSQPHCFSLTFLSQRHSNFFFPFFCTNYPSFRNNLLRNQLAIGPSSHKAMDWTEIAGKQFFNIAFGQLKYWHLYALWEDFLMVKLKIWVRRINMVDNWVKRAENQNRNGHKYFIQYKQIISLSSIMQFICPYNLPMRVQNTTVKLECSQTISKLEGSQSGPFQINHGEIQIKPIFVPYPVEWSNLEMARYAAFILHHKNSFQNRPHAKLWGLYQEMSLFLKSRNYRQCRNHHSRFRRSSMSVNKIIQFLLTNVQEFDALLAIQKQNLNRFYSEKNMFNNIFPLNHKYQYSENQAMKASHRLLGYNQTAEEYNPQIMNMNQNQYKDLRFISNSPFFMQQAQAKSTEKQWVECHNLFLQWTLKLKELKEMSYGH